MRTKITEGDISILELLYQKKNQSQIANDLFYNTSYISQRCKRIREKLGVKTNEEAVDVAIRGGWICKT